MSKLLMMTSMWVMILVPLFASRSRDALKGFKAAVLLSVAINLVWAVVLLALFTSRLGDPQSLLPPTNELEP